MDADVMVRAPPALRRRRRRRQGAGTTESQPIQRADPRRKSRPSPHLIGSNSAAQCLTSRLLRPPRRAEGEWKRPPPFRSGSTTLPSRGRDCLLGGRRPAPSARLSQPKHRLQASASSFSLLYFGKRRGGWRDSDSQPQPPSTGAGPQEEGQ